MHAGTSDHTTGQLAIFIDGDRVAIPAEIGVPATGTTVANPHTHDTTGVLHIGDGMPAGTGTDLRNATLKDFFDVWRSNAGKAGNNANAKFDKSHIMDKTVDATHQLVMFVNGQLNTEYENYVPKADDQIQIVYTANQIVTVQTTLGSIPIELFSDTTPVTVNNFLKYVNDGDYANSFFHRYIPGFVLQGGGFKSATTSFEDPSVNRQFTSVATDSAIQNEFDNWAKLSGNTATVTSGSAVVQLGSNIDLSQVVVGDRIRLGSRTDGLSGSNMFDITAVNDANNTVTVKQTPTGTGGTNVAWKIFPHVNRVGTLAMAKVGGNPDSATSQFFVNLVDNDANLDLQNGGFTVFGQILDLSLLTDISSLNDLSLFNGSLTGAQEVPAVTTTASGTADLALNNATNRFDLTLKVQGIAQGNITGSQLHVGATGQEGNSFFDLGAGAQYTASGTGFQRVVNNGTFPTANLTSLKSGGTYVDVQSTSNADGAIRGQLTAVQSGLYSALPTTSTDQLVVLQSFAGDGQVKGSIFNDTDRDSSRDSGETGRQGMTVYADMNNNGLLDSGEPSTASDASGNYVLRVASGSRKIRLAPASNLGQTLGAQGYDVTLAIGGEVTSRNFAVASTVSPTAVSLVAASDTGASNSDKLTNLNNSAAARSLQFTVSGVTDGATVRVRVDGTVIGQATVPTGAGGTVTVTTNGTSVVSDGSHSITATQEIGGVESGPSAALGITVDATLPVFTSTAPTSATAGTQLTYNAQTSEEGSTSFTYALQNAPSGATINSSSGVVTWTPSNSQAGQQQWQILASDAAGNSSSQTVSVAVAKVPQVRVNLAVTDLNGNPINQINVGQAFKLHGSVQDIRATGSRDGVFSIYEDVVFNGNLAAANSIVHTAPYGGGSSGTITSGLLDEVGSFSPSLQGLGSGVVEFFTATFTANRSGTLTFTGNRPDLAPAHEVGLYGTNDMVPFDEISYGETSLTIVNPNFHALNDALQANEDSTNNSLNVLANDSGQAGRTLSIVAVGTSSRGSSVTIAPDGKTLKYSPAANFFGQDSFTYTVSDGSDEAIATVSVQVAEINDAPVAVDDVFNGAKAVDEDSASVTLNVLENDLTANPDAGAPSESLRITSVGTSSNGGTVTIASGGTAVLYKPAANFKGTETFTYTITDRAGSGGLTDTGTVTVTVNAKNDNPTAVADTVTVDEDSSNNLVNVLANDSSAPDANETLTITAVTSGSRGGQVSIAENGTKVKYTPAANVFGTETFTYTISDGNGGSATATVTATLTAKNDPPDAKDNAFNIAKNSQSNKLDVLLNDVIAPDADETLTVTAVTQGSQGGTVEITESGAKILYKPKADFLGTETFTYTTRDPGGLTDTATVTVTVRDFKPSSLSGFVYIDTDNDGVKDSGEQGWAGAKITLSGTDNFSGTVSREFTSDSTGAYTFDNLPPGTYTIKETQPTGQINSLPIMDGKDTIGSQGGTASVNDQFTITLAEQVTGTGNNFGEITGFKMAGKVQSRGRNSSGQVVNATSSIGGVQLKVFAANSQNQPTGSALKTVTSNPDGSFSIEGIPAGKYVVEMTTPTFLTSGTTRQLVDLNAGDSTNNILSHGGRQARYVSFRDFLSSTPQQGLLVSLTPGATRQEWVTTQGDWSNFSAKQIALSADGKTIRIDVTRSTGEKLYIELPTTDRRVSILGQSGSARLIRLAGSTSQYNLRAVASASNSASGEGENAGTAPNVASASGDSLQIVSPTIDIESPAIDAEGEHSGIAVDSALFAATRPIDVITSGFEAAIAPSSTSESPGEAEEFRAFTSAIDAAFTEQRTAQPVAVDLHNESGGESDESPSLAAVIDAVMSDDGLFG